MHSARAGSVFFLALLAAGTADLNGQSSIFGARGLGFPLRPISTHARATGDAFGLFDGESSLNPASLGDARAVVAGFSVVPSWRRTTTNAGNTTLRETTFPLTYVFGPIGESPVAVGLSIAGYADRDFSFASRYTVSVRGVQVPVFDTLASLGGLSEIRLAGAYRLGAGTVVGGGFHIITGSSRISARRGFADSSYLPIRSSVEQSYAGVGFSIGLLQRVGRSVAVAALARSDGRARVDNDSTFVYRVDLPYTFGLGARLLAGRRVLLAASGLYHTWSSANSDLLAQGGVGARNTVEGSFGLEVARSLRHPAHFPLRLGVRYATLPFPVTSGDQPHQFSVSGGTGARFGHDRAGVDLAFDYAWRSATGPERERALTLTLGLSIKPFGAR